MRRLLVSAGLIMVLAALLHADDKAANDKKWVFIDLQPYGNQKRTEDFHSKQYPGNNLSKLKAGEHTLEGVKFKVAEKLIQLGSQQVQDKPEKVEGIKVNEKLAKLHILHATGYSTEPDTLIGEYTVTWEDDTSVTIPIVYGKDVLDWWCYPGHPDPTRGKVAWKAEHEAAKEFMASIRLYLCTWENPKPDKKIKTIDYSSVKETPCAPFCVAITGEK